MKILAIADRPPQHSVKERVERERPDVICTLGDLNGIDLHELANISNIPKIGVYGNHCSGAYFDELGIENLHLKTKEIGGVLFGGFQGSVRYKQDPSAVMYTDEEAQELLKDFPYADILITHSPPRGVHDEDDPAHRGLKALRDYVLAKQPKYLIHGHTYVSDSTKETLLDSTKIVHVYADQILELNL
jgi:Icc-related predicted phosphoesterase